MLSFISIFIAAIVYIACVGATSIRIETTEYFDIVVKHQCVSFAVYSLDDSAFSFYLVSSSVLQAYVDSLGNRDILKRGDLFQHACIEMLSCSARNKDLKGVNHIVLVNENILLSGTYEYRESACLTDRDYEYIMAGGAAAGLAVCVVCCCCLSALALCCYKLVYNNIKYSIMKKNSDGVLIQTRRNSVQLREMRPNVTPNVLIRGDLE